MSRHHSQHEATDRLYWLLARLDSERKLSWGEAERQAISYVPDDALPWHVQEGDALERTLAGIARRDVSAA